MYPYNAKLEQIIQTDVDGISADRGFIANLNWTALETVAADDDGAVAAEEASESEKSNHR